MADDGLPPGAPRGPGVAPPQPDCRPRDGGSAEEASAAELVQSVAGEEDPGSALEQFSDLMHGSPDESHVAAGQANPSRSSNTTDDSDQSSPGERRAALLKRRAKG